MGTAQSVENPPSHVAVEQVSTNSFDVTTSDRRSPLGDASSDKQQKDATKKLQHLQRMLKEQKHTNQTLQTHLRDAKFAVNHEKVLMERTKQGDTYHMPASVKREDNERIHTNYQSDLTDFNSALELKFSKSVAEYNTAVSGLERQFVRHTSHTACGGREADVATCYERNPSRTLHCADLARKYIDCVQFQRLELLNKLI